MISEKNIFLIVSNDNIQIELSISTNLSNSMWIHNERRSISHSCQISESDEYWILQNRNHFFFFDISYSFEIYEDIDGLRIYCVKKTHAKNQLSWKLIFNLESQCNEEIGWGIIGNDRFILLNKIFFEWFIVTKISSVAVD